MTTFTIEYFTKNYDKFEAHWCEHDVHTEVFYTAFYDEFCSDVTITEEDKQWWLNEWKDALDEEDFEGKTFDEILEENEWLTEDIACWMISDDFPEVKAKAIPALFNHIQEMWSEEAIQDAIDTIKND